VLVHDAEREVYVRACSRYNDDIVACMRDERGLDTRADGCGCLHTSMSELLGWMCHACACRKSMRLEVCLRGLACVSNMLCREDEGFEVVTEKCRMSHLTKSLLSGSVEVEASLSPL
jgi:hypothetical protein